MCRLTLEGAVILGMTRKPQKPSTAIPQARKWKFPLDFEVPDAPAQPPLRLSCFPQNGLGLLRVPM